MLLELSGNSHAISMFYVNELLSCDLTRKLSSNFMDKLCFYIENPREYYAYPEIAGVAKSTMRQDGKRKKWICDMVRKLSKHSSFMTGQKICKLNFVRFE